VNSIENLLFSFNLISKDPIGIRDIEPVDFGVITTDSKDANQDAGTDTSIFRIPVSFSATGQKKDIIDFLHYLENVGSISIED